MLFVEMDSLSLTMTMKILVILNEVKDLFEIDKGTSMSYCVYVMSNISRRLYTGVTNDLERRVYEHKHKLVPGFTAQYNITLLVLFEETSNVEAAITREKQIKGWVRSKKVTLIEQNNPTWADLSADWFS